MPRSIPRSCRQRHIYVYESRRRRALFAAGADLERIEQAIARTERDIVDLARTLEWLRTLGE